MQKQYLSFSTRQVCVWTKKPCKFMKNDSTYVYHLHTKPSSRATKKETHVKKNKRGRCYLLYNLAEDVCHCKKGVAAQPCFLSSLSSRRSAFVSHGTEQPPYRLRYTAQIPGNSHRPGGKSTKTKTTGRGKRAREVLGWKC